MKQKPSLLWPAVTLFLCYAVYGAALVPLYRIFLTDAVLQDTLWLDLIDGAMQWLEIIGLSLCCGFLMDGVYRFSVGACRRLCWLIGGALLFKYVAALAALALWAGVPLSADNVGSSALSLVIELSFCAVVFLLISLRILRAAAAQKARQKAAGTLGEATDAPAAPIPFKRVFARDNVLQTTALLAMALLAAIRVLLWIIDEIAASLYGYAFTAADIPVTLLYWLLLILLPAAAGYFLILFVLQKRAK